LSNSIVNAISSFDSKVGRGRPSITPPRYFVLRATSAYRWRRRAHGNVFLYGAGIVLTRRDHYRRLAQAEARSVITLRRTPLSTYAGNGRAG
jgi:hypothetical protein